MTMIVPSPFKLRSVAHLAATDAPEIDLQGLRDLVTGTQPMRVRSQAMNLLLASKALNRHVEFERVLANESESPELRYQAAVHLGRINTADALRSLIKASATRDRDALIGIVKALGWIGDESAVAVLDNIAQRETGSVAQRARFSASVIAYRLGLEGHDLPVPDEKDRLTVPARTAGLAVAAAGPREIKTCLHSISGHTFGVGLDEDVAYRVTCQRRQLLLLLNPSLRTTKGTLMIGKRKALPGLIATYVPIDDSYSVAYLVLSSPAERPDASRIVITRTNGDVVFSGTARLDGEVWRFSLGAAPRPGAYAIRVKGSLQEGRLTIDEAVSSLRPQVPKNVPTE